jgi:hypothetical protein
MPMRLVIHQLNKGWVRRKIRQTHILLTNNPTRAAPKVFRISTIAEPAMLMQVESTSRFVRTSGPDVGEMYLKARDRPVHWMI